MSHRRTIELSAFVLCLFLLVGSLITAEHYTAAKLAQRLAHVGRLTPGRISKKQATSSGQGRDLCYVTYRFEAPQASAPNAPLATFSREVEVPDRFFDSVTEGQTITVIYDPTDPSISTAEVLIRYPRSPSWTVWTWWTGMAIAISILLKSCIALFRESRASPPSIPGSS